MAQNCHINFMTVLLTINILKVVLPETPICEENFNNDLEALLADCSSYNLIAIPQHLSPQINVLNISFNGLLRISKTDLRRYGLLRAFIFFGLRVGRDIPSYVHIAEDAFSNEYLKEIVEIQLDYISIGGPNARLKFPPTLRRLRFTDSNLIPENLEIHHCKHLEVVDLRNNILTALPRFYKYAPLKVLNVLNTNLGMISPEEISGFCHLKMFRFNITPEMPLLKYFCQCMRLKKWLIIHKIIGYELERFICLPDKKCKNPNITSEMRENYFQCWESNRKDNDGNGVSIPFDQVLFFFVIVAVILFVLIVVSLAIIIAVFKTKVKSKRERKDLIPGIDKTNPPVQEVERYEQTEDESTNSMNLEQATEVT